MQKTRAQHAIEIAESAEGGFRRPADAEVAALAGTRGVVFVEYVALLLLVTIIGAGAVVSLGIPLVNLFRYQQLILSLPIP
ncbi:hypothetical protein [Sandaracinus amylolyticus]|uniref:hypothetical protein n=1 Tax=Sandaracinus amylolyticus TaxID=927083 RepID=UPI001F40A257|nr:hypothetical protein [Sandaracinus amylolyticus]UJR84885.1 Hypothetical protein I5071_69640 [Sandaracinus amylolyticus]